jgi:hypothetical protein
MAALPGEILPQLVRPTRVKGSSKGESAIARREARGIALRIEEMQEIAEAIARTPVPATGARIVATAGAVIAAATVTVAAVIAEVPIVEGVATAWEIGASHPGQMPVREARLVARRAAAAVHAKAVREAHRVWGVALVAHAVVVVVGEGGNP